MVSLSSTEYHFGDMILKPSVRLAKRVFEITNLRLTPSMYTEYRLRRGKHQAAHHLTHISDISAESSSGRPCGDSNDHGSDSLMAGECNVSNVKKIDEKSGGEAEPAHTLESFDEVEVWGMFFDSICSTGQVLCQSTGKLHTTTDQKQRKSDDERDLTEPKDAWITFDDIDMQEPYLFIGLPACTLFMTIFRSFRDPHGIVLQDMRRVELDNCPESFKEMFEMLMVTKARLLEIELQGGMNNGSCDDVIDDRSRLTQKDVVWMQQFLLYSSSDQEMTIAPEDCPSPDRQTHFRQALSHLIGVCIQLTQQPYFKENFLSVLSQISTGLSA